MAARGGLAVLPGRAGHIPAGGPVDGPAAAPSSSAARRAALEDVLASVRHKWGQHSVVRLDEVLAARNGAPAVARRPLPASRRRELPAWWPRQLSPEAGGAVLRPRLLEMLGEPGSGRLSLALAWLAAARPALAAVVEPAPHPCAAVERRAARGRAAERGTDPRATPLTAALPGLLPLWLSLPSVRFYPPAAAGAGVDLRRLVLVRPPAGDARAPLDAVATLLRSEAFDVVLCPLAAGTRISLLFGGKLATLAARSGTSLLLLTALSSSGSSGSSGSSASSAFATSPAGAAAGEQPWREERRAGGAGRGVLGAFAEYRIRLTGRRWLWADGELAGVRLRVATERAPAVRARDEDEAGGTTLPEHELTLRLHRSVRHGHAGPPDLPGHVATAATADAATAGAAATASFLSPVSLLESAAADRLYLAAAVRVARGQPPGPAALSDGAGGDASGGAAGLAWRAAR